MNEYQRRRIIKMILIGKRIRSIIYTAVIAIVTVVSLGVGVSAYQLTSFTYYSQHPMFYYKVDGVEKTDSSDVAVYYTDSPDGICDLYVQVWGSDGTSADANNYTQAGTVVIPEEHLKTIPNTVYQYYGRRCYVSVKMWVYATGQVKGRWSPTTIN